MPLRWRSATERILLTSRLRSSPALASAARWRARAPSTRQSRITHRAMAAPATASSPARPRRWAAPAASE